jgi:hypothetical protein
MKQNAAALLFWLLLLFQAADSHGQTFNAFPIQNINKKYGDLDSTVFLNFNQELPSKDTANWKDDPFFNVNDKQTIISDETGKIVLYQKGRRFYNKDKKLINYSPVVIYSCTYSLSN